MWCAGTRGPSASAPRTAPPATGRRYSRASASMRRARSWWRAGRRNASIVARAMPSPTPPKPQEYSWLLVKRYSSPSSRRSAGSSRDHACGAPARTDCRPRIRRCRCRAGPPRARCRVMRHAGFREQHGAHLAARPGDRHMRAQPGRVMAAAGEAPLAGDAIAALDRLRLERSARRTPRQNARGRPEDLARHVRRQIRGRHRAAVVLAHHPADGGVRRGDRLGHRRERHRPQFRAADRARLQHAEEPAARAACPAARAAVRAVLSMSSAAPAISGASARMRAMKSMSSLVCASITSALLTSPGLRPGPPLPYSPHPAP